MQHQPKRIPGSEPLHRSGEYETIIPESIQPKPLELGTKPLKPSRKNRRKKAERSEFWRYLKKRRDLFTSALLLGIGMVLLIGDTSLRDIALFLAGLAGKELNLAPDQGSRIALVFLGIGVLHFLFYLRLRVLYSDRFFNIGRCPQCRGELKRVHRKSSDKALAKVLVFDSSRYQCKNKKCGWTGVIVKHP
jgi:Zn-finger nucleic acid-binding protein